MAQGLDLKNWDEQRSPSSSSATETKLRLSAILKRTRSSTGSRRIFPPQFKLKVLDSYRNDSDCRGNQRATARKYNIHRRQIQKWLQCEENLRSSVEDASGKASSGPVVDVREASRPSPKRFDSVRSGDGKADATLNRSAMIYARLSDAERSRDGNAVRPTLNPETEVYDRRDSSSSSSAVKLDAWNLKRVAHKLYPSSHVGADESGQRRRSPVRGDGDRVPGDGRNVDAAETPPRDADDKAMEIFTRGPGLGAVAGDAPDDRKLSAGGARRRPSTDGETVDGQKLSAGNAAHERLPQKCADPVPPCDRSESVADPESNRSTPADDGTRPSAGGDDDGDDDDDDGEEPRAKRPKADPGAKVRALKSSDESKSFSPKRKWMQESMLEVSEDGERCGSRAASSYPTLPIKQRVKMDLKSAAAMASAGEEPAPRAPSHNFTIEKLCASDIKAENVTPPSFHSPAESECYNWRPDTCPAYPGYPLVSHSPLTRATLPFPPPPPLLFSHRVIPDLVSLHFKPESPDRGSASGARSCSPESVDVSMLKEEKVSDGEESADVDVLSTTPVEKKAFDFAGCHLGKRRSFSVQFKLTVLDAFYNDKDCNKNQRATARKFNINRRQVQKWLSQESDLRSEGSVKNGKYLQRQRLGNERESDGDESCKQCPQHCNRKKKESEDVDKTIEVNVKHCTDGECLSRDKSSADRSTTPFSDRFEFYPKGCYQSDLKSANIYDNYLLPDSSTMICHNAFLGWPNLNSSALPVPNFHYLSPWYHNFDYCQEKSKIY